MSTVMDRKTKPAIDNLRINGERLWDSLMELAKIGATPKGGVCRLTLTDLDRQGRDLVTKWARDAGMTVTIDRLRFITPGNLLGIPGCAVPTGVADGLPVGVQVYADLWRDDLCLDVGQIIEERLGTITPIDPRSG